jgi:hypothetical protein
MPDIINPYIVGNPVTGQEMFFGRQDVFQFVTQSLIGQYRDNVIVLYGQQRTGKTSVLYQMPSHLGPLYLCIFMDMHGFALEGLGGLLWEIANHILRTLRRDYQIWFPPPNRAEFMIDPRNFFEYEFLHDTQLAIGGRHLLLMLDEAVYLQEQVLAGKLERETFEYMRHLMQHYEWLNFLFSLGSGLEEMEKEYAFLFNAGLYKKISFLDRKAASDLITQPVKDYYQVDPAAVNRIHYVTSGYPYYTQLICHCLFNRWLQERMPHIKIRDVNNVLDEALERGAAVLKYSWEELTPSEKAILAGMATAMNKSNTAIDIKDVDSAWKRYDVSIQEGQKAQAIRRLIARDILVGQEKFAFTVDLQRLWVQKSRRIEWVKEELTNFPFQQHKPTPLLWSINFPLTKLLSIVLAVLLIAGSLDLLYTNYYLPNQQHVSATATTQAISKSNATATATIALSDTIAALYPPYPPNGAQLVLNDPLRDNSHGYDWDEKSSSCQFAKDGYHVSTSVELYSFLCAAFATNFDNIVYEAQMTILKGDSGGLFLRGDADNAKFYYFRIDQTGYFMFIVYTGHSSPSILEDGTIAAFHKGPSQSNLVGIVAQRDRFTLYVNHQQVKSVTNPTFSQGQIGLVASDYDSPAEVVFTNVKVWKL